MRTFRVGGLLIEQAVSWRIRDAVEQRIKGTSRQYSNPVGIPVADSPRLLWVSAMTRILEREEILHENQTLRFDKLLGRNGLDRVARAGRAAKEIGSDIEVTSATDGFANHTGDAREEARHQLVPYGHSSLCWYSEVF